MWYLHLPVHTCYYIIQVYTVISTLVHLDLYLPVPCRTCTLKLKKDDLFTMVQRVKNYFIELLFFHLA